MPRLFDDLATEIADEAVSAVTCAGYTFNGERLSEARMALHYQVWWWLRDNVKEAHEGIE
jgi:hypothetical protein